MQWLYALHLRAPDSTVILVANKCDHAIGDFSSTAQRVEGRVNDRLSEWQHSRGVPGVRENRLPTLNLLPGISSLSCQDGFGLEALIKRVTAQDSTSSIVPPSWNLGLAFIDALRDEKDPLRAAQELLDLPHTDGLCGDSCTSLFISEEAMLEKWRRLCSSLRDTSGELLSTALHSSLLNPEGAMQGALWIRSDTRSMVYDEFFSLARSSVCVPHIEPFFLPYDIQRDHCPCRFFNPRNILFMWARNYTTEILRCHV